MPFTKKIKQVEAVAKSIPAASNILEDPVSIHSLPAPFTGSLTEDGDFLEIGDMVNWLNAVQDAGNMSLENLAEVGRLTFQAINALQEEWVANAKLLAIDQVDDKGKPMKFVDPRPLETQEVFEDKKEAALYGYKYRTDRSGNQDPWGQGGRIPSARDLRAMEARNPGNPGLGEVIYKDGAAYLANQNDWARRQLNEQIEEAKSRERWEKERAQEQKLAERMAKKRAAAASEAMGDQDGDESPRKRARTELAAAVPRVTRARKATRGQGRNSSPTLSPRLSTQPSEQSDSVEQVSPAKEERVPASQPRKAPAKAKKAATMKPRGRKTTTANPVPIAPLMPAGTAPIPTNGVVYPTPESSSAAEAAPVNIKAKPAKAAKPLQASKVTKPKIKAKAKPLLNVSRNPSPLTDGAATTPTDHNPADSASAPGDGPGAHLTDDEIKAMLDMSSPWSAEELANAYRTVRKSKHPKRSAAMCGHWRKNRAEGKQRKPRRSKAEMEADRLAAEAARRGEGGGAGGAAAAGEA